MGCRWCTAPKVLHDKGLMSHDYEETAQAAGPRQDGGDATGAQVKAKVQSSIDPALRQALIDAGVITERQLREAERKIIAMSSQGPVATGLRKQPRPV